MTARRPNRNENIKSSHVVEAVAEQLGNTPAVCRRCYIHPAVLEAFEAGQLTSFAQGRTLDQRGIERMLLKLLDDAT